MSPMFIELKQNFTAINMSYGYIKQYLQNRKPFLKRETQFSSV